MKKCSKCELEKSLAEFSKDKNKKDGYCCKCKSCYKEYRLINKKHIKTHKHNSYINNKEIIIKRNVNYYRNKYKTDPIFALNMRIRRLIRHTISDFGFTKDSKTQQILGCTFEEFKEHIENQFTEGMNWCNRELWHLDHIYPVSKAVDEDHLIQLNHYTNFQPLWAEDNIRKGNKIPEQFM